MTEKRDRLIFDLTEDDRLLLEGVRVKLGLRSHAETIRALIRYAAAGEVPPGFEYVPVATVQALPDVRAKAPIPPTTAASTSSVPLAGTFERKPYQKTGQKR